MARVLAIAETTQYDHVLATLAGRHEVEAATFHAGDGLDRRIRVHRFRTQAAARVAGPVDLVAAQGFPERWPDVSALLEFLHQEGGRFDAILFFGHGAATALGLPLQPERAVLIPTGADAAALRVPSLRAAFFLPRAIGFLTELQRELVHGELRNRHVPHEVLADPAAPDDGDGPLEARLDRLIFAAAMGHD